MVKQILFLFFLIFLLSSLFLVNITPIKGYSVNCPDYSLYFNGTNSYGTLPPITLGGELTIEILMYLPSTSTFHEGMIFTWFYNSSNQLQVDSYTNTRQLKISGIFSGFSYQMPYLPKPLPLTFVYITHTFSVSQGFAKTYLNGTLIWQTSFTPFSRPLLNGQTLIGKYVSGTFFLGNIAFIRVYNRALNSTEIQYNYNNPTNPTLIGLIVWLQAQGGQSLSIWQDLSGNNNNANLYNVQMAPRYCQFTTSTTVYQNQIVQTNTAQGYSYLGIDPYNIGVLVLILVIGFLFFVFERRLILIGIGIGFLIAYFFLNINIGFVLLGFIFIILNIVLLRRYET